MKKIFFLLFLLQGYLIFSTEIVSYDSILVADFISSNSDEGLGYDPNLLGGIQNQPSTYKISKDNKVYICDPINMRLNIYDINFNYLETIKEKNDGLLDLANYINIDISNNIIYYELSEGLVKIDSTGRNIFKINKNLLPEYIAISGSIHLINNYIIYYSNKNGGVINLIDNKGNIISGNSAIHILKSSGLLIEKLYINEKLHIIVNNELITGNYDTYRFYFNTLKLLGSAKDLIEFSEEIYSKKYIGRDNQGNTYWDCSTNYGIVNIKLSRYGEILDIFKIEESNIQFISPDGDLYYIKTSSEEKKISIYKVNK